MVIKSTGISVMLVVFVVTLAGQTWGQAEVPPQAKLPAPGPEKGGLASLYPGDEGIEKDPRVIFVDDFETGTVAETGKRWGHALKQENMTFAQDVAANSPGLRSLQIKKVGHLFTHTRGVDTMYARFYVKFHKKTGYLSHLVILAADRLPTPWPKGGAGTTPPGDSGFCTNIEPTGRNQGRGFAPPGIWQFYTYWHQMKSKWGSVFFGKKEQIQTGRWYCIEAMLKANSAPDKSDGEQAFWVDGVLQGKFDGFNWRTTDKLKINTFWLEYWNSAFMSARDMERALRRDPDFAKRVYEIWFDDIVIATEYIGPVVGKPRGGKKKAVPSKSALLTGEVALAQPGKVVYQQRFEDAAVGFTGGEVVKGGVDGTKAYSFGPNGCSIWDAFSTPVKESTTIRFKLKPLFEVKKDVTILIKSNVLQDNCRYTIAARRRQLKKDEWYSVEFRGLQVRQGWNQGGPSLEGSTLNNFKAVFGGDAADRMLIDDFEICE